MLFNREKYCPTVVWKCKDILENSGYRASCLLDIYTCSLLDMVMVLTAAQMHTQLFDQDKNFTALASWTHSFTMYMYIPFITRPTDLVNVVVPVPLDVRVNNGHHLPPFSSQLILHLGGVRELGTVPREVPGATPRTKITPVHTYTAGMVNKHRIHVCTWTLIIQRTHQFCRGQLGFK